MRCCKHLEQSLTCFNSIRVSPKYFLNLLYLEVSPLSYMKKMRMISSSSVSSCDFFITTTLQGEDAEFQRRFRKELATLFEVALLHCVDVTCLGRFK